MYLYVCTLYSDTLGICHRAAASDFLPQVTFAETTLASAALEFWQQVWRRLFSGAEGILLWHLRSPGPQAADLYRELWQWQDATRAIFQSRCSAVIHSNAHVSHMSQDVTGGTKLLCFSDLGAEPKETELHCQAPALKHSLMAATRDPVCPFGPAAYLSSNRPDIADLSTWSGPSQTV